MIQRAYIHLIWIGLLLASGAEAVRIQDVVPEEVPKRQRDGYYAAVGLGFINLDHRGSGVRVPLGFRAVFNRLRLICSANVLDVSFHEGNDYDPRYFRPYPTRTYCFDTRTGYRVADYRCSGGTDWLRSLSADLAYIVLDEVWIAGDRASCLPGRLSPPKSSDGVWNPGIVFRCSGPDRRRFQGPSWQGLRHLGSVVGL